MATESRPWPNNFGNLRDNIAVLLRKNNELIRSVHMNKLADAEEEFLDEAMRNNEAMLRAIEKAGASTDPLLDVENIASGIGVRVFALERSRC